MTETIDAEVIEPEGELAVREPSPPPMLFGSPDNPEQTIELMTRHAKALAQVIETQKLYVTIHGRRHVLVEGWETLGAMVGVFPVCTWTRQLPNGWEARVEARTLLGAIVGAAEAMCTHDEAPSSSGKANQWKNADEYALRSMAQTRATSKALRMPLAFIVKMAGFDATPAEEMPENGESAPPPAPPAKPKPAKFNVNGVKAQLVAEDSPLKAVPTDVLIAWWEEAGADLFLKKAKGDPPLVTAAQAKAIVKEAIEQLTDTSPFVTKEETADATETQPA